MQKRTMDISVGIFFMLSLIAFALLAFKVSGITDIVSKEGYLVYADFTNVGGLKPRAKVTIAGVPVGRVVAIHFDKKDYLARVVISFDNKINNIPNDTKASILTAGLLGDNYIGLTPGFSDVYLKQNDVLPVENTEGAVVLEQLVSKFFSSQASGLKDREN